MLSKLIGAKNLIVSSVDPYLTVALVRVSLQASRPPNSLLSLRLTHGPSALLSHHNLSFLCVSESKQEREHTLTHTHLQ